MNQNRHHLPLLIPIVGLVSMFLLGVNVYLSATVSDMGIKVKELERKAQDLKLENQRLEYTLLEKTSLTDIIKAAPTLGFVDTVSYVNLSDGTPVAYNR